MIFLQGGAQPDETGGCFLSLKERQRAKNSPASSFCILLALAFFDMVGLKQRGRCREVFSKFVGDRSLPVTFCR